MRQKPRRQKKSFYTAVSQVLERMPGQAPETGLNINATVRRLRLERNLRGTDLCRKAGDITTKTLTALEKGRIINPSIATLKSLARGLGMTVTDIFREAETGPENTFFLGTQKGAFLAEIPHRGIRIISLTPFMEELFVGRMIFGSRKSVDEMVFGKQMSVFAMVLSGRFEFVIEGRKAVLEEGQNILFNAAFRHSIMNSLYRESTLMVVTTPSLSGQKRLGKE